MDSSDQTSAFLECGDAGEFLEEKSKGMEEEVVNERGRGVAVRFCRTSCPPQKVNTE
jgi:hypothetical protein